MKAHVVLAHPETQSFNGTLAETTRTGLAALGYETTLSDLYQMDFDARERAAHYPNRQNEDIFHAQSEQRFNAANETLPANVEAEIRRLEACELLVVHFPLWWFGPPAILKGWMDRVFVYGRLYKSARRYDKGFCAGKKMIACVTTGASADNCAYNGREGDTFLHLWPILFPFRYLGFDVLVPQVFHGIGGVAFIEGKEDGLKTLETSKADWANTLAQISDRPRIKYNRDEDFDACTRLRQDAPSHSPFIRHEK